MKNIKSLLALLLIGFVSVVLTTSSFASEGTEIGTVQFTLVVTHGDEVTLTATKQVNSGINAIEAIGQLVAMQTKDTDWGPMIISLAGIEAVGNTYWAIFVNGQMSMVGAQDVILNAVTYMRLILTSF